MSGVFVRVMLCVWGMLLVAWGIPHRLSQLRDGDARLQGEGPSASTSLKSGSRAGTSTGPRLPDRALGMGLAGLADWSTQFPFLDLVKSARWWRGNDQVILDENGWVKDLNGGPPAEMFFLSTRPQSPPPFRWWVVRYRGQGVLDYQLAARRDPSRSHRGRDVIQIDPGQTYAVIKLRAVDPRDHIRDISIVPLEYEKQFDDGMVFNPLWIERIKDFRALRFMDWMATNHSTIRRWEDRPRIQHASWAFNPRGEKVTQGVPLEIMIDLANQVNADPWFNIPHLADDDYVERFARMVKERLNRGLIAHVEHSNEVWNWGFAQAQHANRAGRALWGDHGNAYIQWHGMRTARICDIWKRVFTGETDRVICVLGLQAHYPGLAKPALDCPLWKDNGGKRCDQHGLDAIAIAGYVSGCLDGRSDDAAPAATKAAKAPQDPSRTVRRWAGSGAEGMRRALEQLTDGRHFSCRETVQNMGTVFRHYAVLARARGLAVLAYEAGQHLTGAGGPLAQDEAVARFFIALNRHPGMKIVYRDLLAAWKREGGQLLAHFVDVQWPSRFGSWGALEFLTQDTSPKWEALQVFTRQNCWWEGC